MRLDDSPLLRGFGSRCVLSPRLANENFLGTLVLLSVGDPAGSIVGRKIRQSAIGKRANTRRDIGFCVELL